MQVIRTIDELRMWRSRQRGRIGVVPTMGYLHEGHLSLVRAIRASCEVVIATIFVNPTQFNQQEDLEKYPRDEERDISLLAAEKVDVVFLPSAEDMYPSGVTLWVTVEGIVEPMEGLFRPGHFRGVTTVVAKLFSLIQPDVAIFGEKDFQQLRVIEEMTKGLLAPISIIRGALVREEDGLALSSRNVRLTAADRVSASAISRGLRGAQALFLAGESDPEVMRASITRTLAEGGVPRVDYVEIVDEETLRPISPVTHGSRICVAAWVGGVRLIDTMGLTHKPKSESSEENRDNSR
jgi:pantoate--beta-alanine ligase